MPTENKPLNALNVQRQKLDALRSERKRGEYEAAGLRISLGVGASDGTPLVIELGIASDVGAILDAVDRGLVDSLAFWHRRVIGEYQELVAYVANNKEAPK